MLLEEIIVPCAVGNVNFVHVSKYNKPTKSRFI